MSDLQEVRVWNQYFFKVINPWEVFKLKEFESLENDVCHTVVFGNVTAVLVSCKTLHWTQMADGSKVF